MNNRSIEKIGKGGNNLVYETKKNSENGLILKFNFHSINMLINSILGRIDDRSLLVVRNMIEKRDNNILSSYKDDVEKEIENYNNLSQFFDKKNLLNEKVFNINSSCFNNSSNNNSINEIINNLTSVKGINNIKLEDVEKIKSYVLEKDVEIPVIIQEKFDFKNKENVFEFNSEIPIYNNFEKILKEDLIKKDYTNTIEELSRFIKDNNIYELLHKDPSSKDIICDFLKRAISYTKNTHKFIDFFGGENIFFYKENDIYQYKLVDPIMSMTNYSNNPNFRNSSFEDFLDKNKEDLRHFYVYIKTINSLAKDLGINERLKPEDYFGMKINGVEGDLNNFIK